MIKRLLDCLKASLVAALLLLSVSSKAQFTYVDAGLSYNVTIFDMGIGFSEDGPRVFS